MKHNVANISSLHKQTVESDFKYSPRRIPTRARHKLNFDITKINQRSRYNNFPTLQKRVYQLHREASVAATLPFPIGGARMRFTRTLLCGNADTGPYNLQGALTLRPI